MLLPGQMPFLALSFPLLCVYLFITFATALRGRNGDSNGSSKVTCKDKKGCS